MPGAVSNAVRVGAVAIVVGLVGYAVWVASRPDASSSTTAPTSASRKAAGPGGGTRAGSGDSPAGQKATSKRVPPSKEGSSDRPVPAPMPPADIDFEKTLDALEAFVTDIESLKERGIKIQQPEWVERYRKGNELVDSLMRAPEAADTRVKKEVLDLNMRFRAVIQDLLAPP